MRFSLPAGIFEMSWEEVYGRSAHHEELLSMQDHWQNFC